jgi:cell division protein FtsB
MPTKLKRPPFWRHLAISAGLLGFLGYLGYSALNGQFGIESRDDILADIAVLEARSSALQADIDATQHRIGLFDSRRLDPDVLDEQARRLLSMAHPDDMLTMVDPSTGQLKFSSNPELSENQLNSILGDNSGV